ncbi:hypothetical protein GOQ30_09590 [Flavobacterium sp. TP390]|uniref:Lipoprotein n=1 Tax=Flavobacterium profundi TaxID=1774945 RepID=A0A6I4II84_9FLAO|nr:hypothetical protein [Flavobacterium profundi]MVO09410.1 hypothetical protein [Flavobacterium profundi]
MKNYIILLLTILLFTSCQEDITSNLKQIETNLKTDNSSVSEFILTNDTIIKGKLGTEIFIPKDLFANYTNGKITFELKEYFSKEDMILNGLSTITDNNEVLESSGMLYINFTENGKQLTIKEGKKYEVRPAEAILDRSNVYLNDNDSIFKWKLTDEIMYTAIIDYKKNRAYGLTTNYKGEGGFFKNVPIDSFAFIKKRDSLEYIELLKKDSIEQKREEEEIKKRESELNFVLVNENDKSKEKSIYYDILEDKSLTEEQKSKKIMQRDAFLSNYGKLYSFTTNKLGWINIDRIVQVETTKSIQISNNHKLNSNEYSLFYSYLDNKSIINHFLANFKEDYTYNLKIAGKIKVIVYTNDNDKVYYDSFYIDKNSKTNFEINLKETSLENLKKTLITP